MAAVAEGLSGPPFLENVEPLEAPIVGASDILRRSSAFIGVTASPGLRSTQNKRCASISQSAVRSAYFCDCAGVKVSRQGCPLPLTRPMWSGVRESEATDTQSKHP